MELVLVTICALVVLFGFVVLFGAPYLPTLGRQAETAIELLKLKKGDRLLELGAGDGTVALVALQKGISVTAIEINPLLCVVIYLRTFRYRSKIRIRCGNFWTTPWGEYDGIYTFLLDKYMTKLDNKIIQENKTTKLASFAFKIPGRRIQQQNNDVYLYCYDV